MKFLWPLSVVVQSSTVRGCVVFDACSGPVIQLKFAVKSFNGVSANCPVTDIESLLSLATSQPTTGPAVTVSHSVGEYDRSAPTCVKGIAKPNRNDREKFRLLGDSITSYPSSVTNLPAFTVSPLPSGTLYAPYASSRSNAGVFRNGNASSEPRKIPSAWFFCASCPAVRTTPKPNG